MLTDGPEWANRPRVNWGFSVAGEDPRPFLSLFSGTIVNLPGLEAAASSQGSINSSVDIDGIIRYVPVLFRLKGDDTVSGEVYPRWRPRLCVWFRARHPMSSNRRAPAAIPRSARRRGLTRCALGASPCRPARTARSGCMTRDMCRKDLFRPGGFWPPEHKGADVEGRIVIIGTSAAGLKDIRSTALNPVAAGVEIQAQALEQVILGGHLLRPASPPGHPTGLYAVDDRVGERVGADLPETNPKTSRRTPGNVPRSRCRSPSRHDHGRRYNRARNRAP